MARAYAGDVKRGDLLWVLPEEIIYDDKDNARWRAVTKERVLEVAQSMLDNGQEQPCGVHEIEGKKLKLHAGLTRLKAGLLINKLGLTGNFRPDASKPWRLQCVFRDASGEEAFVHSIIENKDRLSTTIIDDASNVRVLSEGFGWSDDKIADLYHIKKADRPKRK